MIAYVAHPYRMLVPLFPQQRTHWKKERMDEVRRLQGLSAREPLCECAPGRAASFQTWRTGFDSLRSCLMPTWLD